MNRVEVMMKVMQASNAVWYCDDLPEHAKKSFDSEAQSLLFEFTAEERAEAERRLENPTST